MKPPTLPAAPAGQLEVDGAEAERAGVDDVTDPGEVQAPDGAEPATKPSETEYDPEAQKRLRLYLGRDEFPLTRHRVRQAAAAARTFTPKSLKKVRRRMEGRRQWITDFLAALDEAAD